MSCDLAGVKLFIFDADGTLRWSVPPGRRYPLAHGEWRLMPGVAEKLRAMPWAPAGPWLAIASNQNGVAAGELSEELALALLRDMLTAALGRVPDETRIETCTCDARLDCFCRKPAPGLLLRLLAHYGVPPVEALFIGDLDSDAEAARRAGIAFMRAERFFAPR
jgi:histidinol-phosphate phosphatase family protein